MYLLMVSLQSVCGGYVYFGGKLAAEQTRCTERRTRMNRSRVIVEPSVRWNSVPARGASVISNVVLRQRLQGCLSVMAAWVLVG